ncbi:MAG: rhodanese-related sulfurtransferase [Chlorobi bacterium CHB2]|nr:rhodanese-related sulfurtransferase [Chlorobi bacterium CHB2]
MNELERIQHWFISHCDGEYEHHHGVSITTLDNPGWKLRIDLEGTELEDRLFKDFEIDEGDKRWIFCRKHHLFFEGACDTHSLFEMLNIFLDWSESKAII